MWIIELLKTWAGLITKLWGSYPFVGAVVTAAAVVGCVVVRKTSKRPPAIDLALSLLAWAIVVPVLGASLDVVGAAIRTAWAVLAFFGTRYSEQPLFVGAVAIVAIAAFAISEWLAKHRRRPTRLLVVTGAAVAIIAVGVPILNWFWPNASVGNTSKNATRASAVGR